MIKYGVEVREVWPAPELVREDLMTQSEAWRLLGVRQQTLGVWLADGRFTVVWDLGRDRAGARSARLLLRAEVEAAVAGERGPGGACYRSAPEVTGDESPAPLLDGVAYGVERRVIRSVPAISVDDVMDQKAAWELLGVHKSTLARQMNRGRLTIVWDLERRDGLGSRSARVLLRAEVEEVAAGGRCMGRASYRMPPGVRSAE